MLYDLMQNGKHKWYSDLKQTTLWNFDKLSVTRNIRLASLSTCWVIPIGNSTHENGVVIDTFDGSGSTPVTVVIGGNTTKLSKGWKVSICSNWDKNIIRCYSKMHNMCTKHLTIVKR